MDTVNFSYDFLSKIFQFRVTKDTKFQILESSPSGKILKLQIGQHTMDGKKFIQLLHLKSQFFSIIINVNSLSIITHGWGNGLGLSLYGASYLADNGCNFANILRYYFPKIKICEYIKELSS